MSESTADDPNDPTAPPGTSAEADAPQPDPSPSPESPSPESPWAGDPDEFLDEAATFDRAAELEEEVADLKDKLLRALAETENVRRRAVRDKSDASRYAVTAFARELLPVADNLRRALDSVTAESRAGNESFENLVVGVEMTETAMLTAFERAGIKSVEALGTRFDHNLHEALFEVQDPDQPAGTVVQEMEKGYVLNDRLLRPAKVALAKGGAKPGPAAEANEPAAETPGATAYEKKVDAEARAGASGIQVDEEL